MDRRNKKQEIRNKKQKPTAGKIGPGKEWERKTGPLPTYYQSESGECAGGSGDGQIYIGGGKENRLFR